MWAPTAVGYVTDSNQPEPTYESIPISEWIQTKSLLNSNRLSLTDLLTLRQISTPDDWGIVNFELPMAFVSGVSLHLGEINKGGEFVVVCFEDCYGGTNGLSQLKWNTSYDPPRKFNLRAKLTYYNHLDSISVIGPPLTHYSSNACRFFEAGSMYDDMGAFLDAELREDIATFRIELQTVDGRYINTISGRTTNGFINSDWDLREASGQKFTGKEFVGVFHITYPNSSNSFAPAKKFFTKF